MHTLHWGMAEIQLIEWNESYEPDLAIWGCWLLRRYSRDIFQGKSYREKWLCAQAVQLYILAQAPNSPSPIAHTLRFTCFLSSPS
jgi:hypothetical protein